MVKISPEWVTGPEQEEFIDLKMQGIEISNTPLFICAAQGGSSNKNDV